MLPPRCLGMVSRDLDRGAFDKRRRVTRSTSWPFIDVMLVLLIIFMVAAPLATITYYILHITNYLSIDQITVVAFVRLAMIRIMLRRLATASS